MNSEIYFKYHHRKKRDRETISNAELSHVRGDLVGLQHIVKERQMQKVQRVSFPDFVRYVIDEAALGINEEKKL